MQDFISVIMEAAHAVVRIVTAIGYVPLIAGILSILCFAAAGLIAHRALAAAGRHRARTRPAEMVTRQIAAAAAARAEAGDQR